MVQREIYGLSKADVTLLKRQLTLLKSGRPPTRNGIPEDDVRFKSDNNYIAYAPKDEFIPAMQGDKPGALECCIFTVAVNTREDNTYPDLEDMDIIPIGGFQDEDGNNVVKREYVYNVYELNGETNKYFQVWRSKAGQFFCEKPSGENDSNTTTTTTTFSPPSDNDTGGFDQTCSGTCGWIWNDTTKLWVLDSNNCGGPPTSTSTSTTLGPSTTTSSTTTTACPCPPTTTEDPTDVCAVAYCAYECDGFQWRNTENNCDGWDCLCQDDPGFGCEVSETGDTTSYPCTPRSTTTSTTSSPCDCRYPEFCGTSDGDCTETDCKPLESVQTTPDCGQTNPTTTSCDCNTTTTTPDPNIHCTDGCQWYTFPTGGGWILVENNCAYNCPCPYPDVPSDPCTYTPTGCIPTTSFPPDLSCSGTCFWIYWDGRWYYSGSTCTFYSFCYCDVPSIENPEPCKVYTFGCTDHREATTRNPCDDCYTTTSTEPTTTTTEAPCSQECEWSWNGTIWVNDSNPCPAECPCEEPPYDGADTCSVAVSACGSGTTTSAPGACCYNTDVGLFCANVFESICTNVHNGTFYINQSCSGIDCNTTTTASPAIGACCHGEDLEDCVETTESKCTALGPPSVWKGSGTNCSTDPCAPCDESNCIYQCNGIVWSNITDNCVSPCYCPYISPTIGCDVSNNGTTTLVPCELGATTPTPTTTSTTTAAPTGACCYYFEGSNLCVITSEENCASTYGSTDFNAGQTCEEVTCDTPVTTSSTTTLPPEDCRFNFCELTCINGFWVPTDNPCGAECFCPGPGQGEGDSGDPQVGCTEPGEVYNNRCAFL